MWSAYRDSRLPQSELASVSSSNRSSLVHPEAVLQAEESAQRDDLRKPKGSKRKLLDRRCATAGIAVNETSLPFRNPHPEPSWPQQGTKPRDALLRTGDLTIRAA